MIVHGSKDPGRFQLVPMPKKPGYVEVWLYENVEPYTDTREDREFNGYQYDRYTLEYYGGDISQEYVEKHYAELLRLAKDKLSEEEAEKAKPSAEDRMAQMEADIAYLAMLTDTDMEV